jgi:transcriptional regulator
MYTPPFNAVHDEDWARSLVAAARTGWLVTAEVDGTPVATSLPILWRGTRVIAHMARANNQWRQIGDGARALLIVGGPEAYVSPSWYAAKAEHGKVVPTWNYSAVHLTGTVTVHDDPAWLRAAVTDLTDAHEAGRAKPWQVADAPEQYLDAQLRGIVGIELQVERVEAKAKLSQNRSEADRRGVVERLRSEPLPPQQRAQALAVAETMSRALPDATAAAAEGPPAR